MADYQVCVYLYEDTNLYNDMVITLVLQCKVVYVDMSFILIIKMGFNVILSFV